MDEQTLRSWVRRELPPERRREVSRWLVRCTDPAVGDLLQGLVREAEEAPLDHALAAVGDRWSALVDAWWALVERGRAAWSDASGPDVVVADVGGVARVAPVFEVEGDAYAVALVAPVGDRVRVFLTNDRAEAAQVAEGELDASGRWTVGVARDGGGRPTLWVVVIPPPFTGADAAPGEDAAAHLARLVARPEVRVDAWREVGDGE